MNFLEYLFGKNPKNQSLEINHSKLGKLIYEDEGWWKGETEINGLKIEFFVNGNEENVNEILAEDCAEVLENFNEYKQKALLFLEKQRLSWKIKQELKFTPTDFCLFFREGENKYFSMNFEEETRPDFLWTVDFENSEAKYAGFDS